MAEMAVADAFAGIMAETVNALWAVLIIAVFFLAGYFVASVINYLIKRLFQNLNIEKMLSAYGMKKVLGDFSFTQLTTFLVKIFVILSFLGAAAEYVDIPILASVLVGIVAYIPSLVEGMIIIMVALLLADYLASQIKKTKEMPFTGIVAMIIQIFFAYIALILALPLILPSVDVTILTEAFRLFFGAAAIAFGVGFALAIGFGLRDSISSAARKNQAVFDDMFGKFGSKKKKR